MQYFRWLRKVHPSSNCTKTITNTKSGKKSDDGKSKLSKSRSSAKNSKSESINKLCKSHFKTKKALTTLNKKIEEMNNKDSDLTDSYDDDDEENPHLQFEEK